MHLMKGVTHMQLDKINILLITKDESTSLVLEDYQDIILLLSDDGTADIEKFFSGLINLLLKKPFKLNLVIDAESPQLVKEVAEKYVERLNIEIDNIIAQPEYKMFSESD